MIALGFAGKRLSEASRYNLDCTAQIMNLCTSTDISLLPSFYFIFHLVKMNHYAGNDSLTEAPQDGTLDVQLDQSLEDHDDDDDEEDETDLQCTDLSLRNGKLDSERLKAFNVSKLCAYGS